MFCVNIIDGKCFLPRSLRPQQDQPRCTEEGVCKEDMACPFFLEDVELPEGDADEPDNFTEDGA